ncbi:hypothetical protein B0J14DRAFT_637409 [Halenospora varia]|nr:hypothetical protein B0J14DRAFT_637409 [Halenospora varia]
MPITLHYLIFRKVKSSSEPTSKRTTTGLSILSIIVGTILILFILIFFCMFIYEYKKASRLRAQTSTKINIGEVSKDALFSTVTLGLTKLYQAKHLADRANTNRGTVDTPTHVDERRDTS